MSYKEIMVSTSLYINSCDRRLDGTLPFLPFPHLCALNLDKDYVILLVMEYLPTWYVLQFLKNNLQASYRGCLYPAVMIV